MDILQSHRKDEGRVGHAQTQSTTHVQQQRERMGRSEQARGNGKSKRLFVRR